jgi:hypothetical protein
MADDDLPPNPPSETPYLDAHGFDPDGYDWVPVLRRARVDGWTPDRQRRFIETLADCGSVAHAAREVGKSEVSAYRLRRSPGAEDFDRAWSAAIKTASKKLIDAAFHRALVGHEEPVYNKDGDMVGVRTRHSDRLLMFLMSTYMPKPFGMSVRERQMNYARPEPVPPPIADALDAMWPERPDDPHLLVPPAVLDRRIMVADNLYDGELPRQCKEASDLPATDLPGANPAAACGPQAAPSEKDAGNSAPLG